MFIKYCLNVIMKFQNFLIITANRFADKIPDSCFKNLSGPQGIIDSKEIDEDCKRGSEGHALDVLWRIETDKNTKVLFKNYQRLKSDPNKNISVNAIILKSKKMMGHIYK